MTSIEWLEMEIVKLESKFPIPHVIYELSEKAKEIHKQEVQDFGARCCLKTTLKNDWTLEQLYKDMFKTK